MFVKEFQDLVNAAGVVGRLNTVVWCEFFELQCLVFFLGFFVGLMEILDETSKLCGCMVTRILNVVNRIEPGCTMIMTTKKVEGLCCRD